MTTQTNQDLILHRDTQGSQYAQNGLTRVNTTDFIQTYLLG